MIIVQKAWENELGYINLNKEMKVKDYIHKFIDGFPLKYTKNRIIKYLLNKGFKRITCYKALKRDKTLFENIFSRKLMYKEDIYDFLGDYLKQHHYINAKMFNNISNYNFISDLRKLYGQKL